MESDKTKLPTQVQPYLNKQQSNSKIISDEKTKTRKASEFYSSLSKKEKTPKASVFYSSLNKKEKEMKFFSKKFNKVNI